MTKRIDDTVYIEEEKPQQCDECGKVDELRPYGAGGATVCYDCGMTPKHKAAVEAAVEAMFS